MISIRPATPQDADAIAAIYAPYVTDTTISFEVTPPTPQEISERMATTLSTHPYLVLEEEGEVRGYAYAGRFSGRAAYDWSAEVSIYLDQARRGKGMGTFANNF